MIPARPTIRPLVTPALALALGLGAAWAGAQSPLPAVAIPGEVSVVTPSPPPVLRIGAGTFLMGSDPAGIDQARTMCVRSLERFASARGGSAPDPGVGAGFNMQLRLCDVEGFLNVVCGAEYFAHEAMAHEVWLPTYGIDRTEVTVAAYDRCVRHGALRSSARRSGDAADGRGDAAGDGGALGRRGGLLRLGGGEAAHRGGVGARRERKGREELPLGPGG